MVKEEEISVAVMYPGGRLDRIMRPLQATDMDVGLEPSDAYDRDIIMLDNADKMLFKPVLKARNRDVKVLYRIRGDMLRAYRELNVTPCKYYMAKYLIGKVDGAVSIEPVLGERFHHATGVNPIGYASLAKDPTQWPTVHHPGIRTIYGITLTNTNYMGKIQPLINYAPLIDDYLHTNGGYWNIYGRGRFDDYLGDTLAGYSHVNFRGYDNDVKERLRESNAMFHFSTFDSMPNAILEGMASGLPVITNPYSVFEAYGDPLVRVPTGEIQSVLDDARRPAWREAHGARGINAVRERHSPEVVGQQYVTFFKSLLS